MKTFSKFTIITFFCTLIVSFIPSCNVNNKYTQSLPKVNNSTVLNSNAATTPNLTLTYSNERIDRGEKIYKSATTKYNFVPPQPIVNGWCKDVIVPMPINEWKKLSGQDKVNVSLYAENVILDIRANPQKYIDIPKSAPMYESCFKNASEMCNTCWSVEVGSVATIDGETNLGPDSERVVEGKSAVEFRKAQEK